MRKFEYFHGDEVELMRRCIANLFAGDKIDAILEELDSDCSEIFEGDGECYVPAYASEMMRFSAAEDEAERARQRDFFENALTCGQAGCGPTESWFGKFLQ